PGLLADPAFEASVGPGGALSSEAAALRRLVTRLPAAAIDVAVEPAVIDQLSRMVDGYRRIYAGPVSRGEGGAADAAAVLGDLRAVEAGSHIDLSAMPFAAPLLPSLVSEGLGRDLDRQRELGERTLAKALNAT